MSEPFSAAEVATIRKFFAWIAEERWLSQYDDEGLVGVDDEGILCTEFNATEDYGSPTLEREKTVIPWLALTDPDAYAAQVRAEEAARKREEAARVVEYQRQREANERAAYEALKAKFG